MKKYYWLVILTAVVFCSITCANTATAGPLVDTAKKVETKWEEVKRDNKDVKKMADKTGEAWEAGKKWVNEQTKKK